MSRFLTSLYVSLKQLVEPLLERISSLERIEYLFYRYGWQLSIDEPAFARIREALAIKTALQKFLEAVGSVESRLDEDPEASLTAEETLALADSAAALIEALAEFDLSSLDGLPAPLNDPDFWKNIAGHVFDDLLEEFLRIYHPIAYAVLLGIGCLSYKTIDVEGSVPHRRRYTRVVFDWQRATDFIQAPPTVLKNVYRWGDTTQPFDHERLVAVLELVSRVVRFPATRIAPSLATPLRPDSPYRLQDDVDALRMVLSYGLLLEQRITLEIGLELLPAAKVSEPVASGIVVRPVLRGGAEGSVPIAPGWSLKWKTAADAGAAIGVAVFPDKADLVGGPVTIGATLEVTRTDPNPWTVVGTPRTAHIDLVNPSLSLSIEGDVDEPEARLRFSAGTPGSQPGAMLVVPLDAADSFVKETVKQSQFTATFSPEVIWSSRTGLTFNGSAGLGVDIPVDLAIGPVRIRQLVLRLDATSTGERPVLEFEASAGMDLTLGPVMATIDRIGMRMGFDFATEPRNFGIADVSLDFKPPSGIGLRVDATGVSGGGYLFLDPAKGQYAGVVQLNLDGGLTLNAIGLVSTRLPNGAKGFSFLIVITAEGFSPIPLGLGFTLTGIGGLLAINRTANEEFLREGLKSRTLDDLLFPEDPIRNAAQLIGTFDRAFPPQPGSFIFGPVVQICWGTPPLITMDLALLLELGERHRLIILGRVAAIMPSEKHDLIRLQMNALGVIDFDKGSISLDAVLYDSRLAGRFPITGSMAMRLSWNTPKVFALSIGGFHPAFKPPPQFPALQRLAITFADTADFKLRLECYYALTSNTLQFGAKVELFARAGGFSIAGLLGYDVLIQFDPFAFIADFRAAVQVQYHSRNLFKVSVTGQLSGPRPLHVKGKATFEIFWCDISVRFDKTLISGGAPPPIPPVNVTELLTAALGDARNWKGPLAAADRRMVTLREPADQSAIPLHPLGTLSVSQTVVPLDLDIAKFGNAAPADATRFSIASVLVDDRPAAFDRITDFFAPSQFLDLSDDEKLAAPSFEPMTSGIRVGAAGSVFTSKDEDIVEDEKIAFETILIDTAHEDDKDEQEQPPASVVTHEFLNRYVRLGAAARSSIRRAGNARFQAAEVSRNTLVRQRWTIVSREDATSMTGDPASGVTSYAQSFQAVQQMKRENPARAKQMMLVRIPAPVKERDV
jgi:hypothetical protein